jgi:hemerythrin-like metal-binding protein
MGRMPEILLVAWNDEKHMTKIKIIDEQHRGVLSIINSVHYMLVDKHDLSHLRTYGETVVNYLKIHFRTEMDILRASHYPGLRLHKIQHDEILAEGENILHDDFFKKGGEPKHLLTLLKKYWMRHVLEEDMAFSGHLIDHIKTSRRVIRKNS